MSRKSYDFKIISYINMFEESFYCYFLIYTVYYTVKNELFIKNIAWSTSLKTIEFQQTEVSDGLATSLSNMPNLTNVYLTHANISEHAKQRLRETTQRRVSEKLAEPAQTVAVLLGTQVAAGASSPILNAFVKNTLYDKKLWSEIINFMRSKEPPRELHSKFTLEDL